VQRETIQRITIGIRQGYYGWQLHVEMTLPTTYVCVDEARLFDEWNSVLSGESDVPGVDLSICGRSTRKSSRVLRRIY
jgi:hypothetical protein